jgi:hypothetical protein
MSGLAPLDGPSFDLLASPEAELDGAPSQVIMCRASADGAVLLMLDPATTMIEAAELCEMLRSRVAIVHVEANLGAASH